MKAIRHLTLAAALLTSSDVLAAEWTTMQVITEIQYDGAADRLWLIGPAKWGAAACPNATWIVVQSTVEGRKQILSLVTAAQMAGKRVAFWGTCDPDTSERFNATLIRVVD